MITEKHILHTNDEHESVEHFLMDRYEKLKKGKRERIKEKSAFMWKQTHKDTSELVQQADSLSR
jgi:hypothetical protein